MPVNESEGDRVGGEPSFRLLAGNTISVSFLPLPARGLRSKTVELRCNSGEDDTASRASKLCDKHMGDVDSGPDVSILLGMGRAGEGEQPVLSC